MGKTTEDTRDHGDKSSGAMIFHFLPSVRALSPRGYSFRTHN